MMKGHFAKIDIWSGLWDLDLAVGAEMSEMGGVDGMDAGEGIVTVQPTSKKSRARNYFK